MKSGDSLGELTVEGWDNLFSKERSLMVLMLILLVMLGSAGLGTALAQAQSTQTSLGQESVHDPVPFAQPFTPQTVPLPPQWSG